MSDEGTTGYCLVPEAGTEEGRGAAQGYWGADGGVREPDPSVLHFILDPSLLRRWVCGLCRGLAPVAAGLLSAWMLTCLWSAGLRLPALAAQSLTSCGMATV